MSQGKTRTPGLLSQCTFVSFLSLRVGKHLAWGGPAPAACEQGLGCLADMSVMNTRWEVSEACTLLSLSIHLPRAGRDSRRSGPCHSRSLPGFPSERPASLASR